MEVLFIFIDEYLKKKIPHCRFSPPMLETSIWDRPAVFYCHRISLTVGGRFLPPPHEGAANTTTIDRPAAGRPNTELRRRRANMAKLTAIQKQTQSVSQKFRPREKKAKDLKLEDTKLGIRRLKALKQPGKPEIFSSFVQGSKLNIK